MAIRSSRCCIYRFLVLSILPYALVACGIYPATSRGYIPSPLAPPTITPTPLGYIEPTRTPTPTWDANYDPAKVTPVPTWTPTVTPVIINMAETLPVVFTYSFTIERANGRREVYIVPVGFVPMVRTESDWALYEQYVQSLANLGPGDRYIGGCAASPWMIVVPQQMICYTKYASPGPWETLTPTPTPEINKP